MERQMEPCQLIERSIIKKYRKERRGSVRKHLCERIGVV